MPVLDSAHQQEIDALIKDISINSPKDFIQHCANYFNRRLESERSSHLSGSTMSDSAGPGPLDRNRTQNTIEEEDEEQDTFDSPTQTNFRSKGGPPSSSPFGGSSSGGLFGGWVGGQASDDADAAQHNPANFPGAGRRTSVSAEAMQPDADSSNWKPPKNQKTPAQLDRLKTAVASNFLFTHLDDESFTLVLDALSEKTIPAANIRVINQGDEGDYFYVIEDGDFDVYIHESGAPVGTDVGKKVATVGPGGSKLSNFSCRLVLSRKVLMCLQALANSPSCIMPLVLPRSFPPPNLCCGNSTE